MMINLATKNDLDALKGFAITMSWAFPLFFMLIIPWLFNHNIHWWPLVVSGAMMALYLVFPVGIYYPYRVWMAIAGVLGWINTRIILGVAFYLLIFPIGLLMRTLGKLQYKTVRSSEKPSFFIDRTDELTKEKLKDPF